MIIFVYCIDNLLNYFDRFYTILRRYLIIGLFSRYLQD